MPYFEVLALPIPAIIVLVFNISPDAHDGKALIAFNIYVSIFMAIDAYVCAVTCASFCTNIQTLIDLGDARESEKSVTGTSAATAAGAQSSGGSVAQLKTLSFHVGIVQLFAMAFGLIATPLFIVFASSPYMRHKVMWTHLICLSCAAFPQLLVLVIFMPRSSTKAEDTASGARIKTSSVTESAAFTSTTKVHVSSNEDALDAGSAASTAANA